MRTERQKHGFIEEDYIRQKYLIDTYSSNYTSPWDGKVHQDNVFHKVNTLPLMPVEDTIIPVSIKTKKINGAVEMGDLMRNATKEEGFILAVGFWKDTLTKNIVERHTIYLPLDEWSKNFPIEITTRMSNIFKDNNISNSYDDDKKWKIISKKYRQEWKLLENGININFKRDHKKQKRVQCSIKRSYFQEISKKYSIEIGLR